MVSKVLTRRFRCLAENLSSKHFETISPDCSAGKSQVANSKITLMAHKGKGGSQFVPLSRDDRDYVGRLDADARNLSRAEPRQSYLCYRACANRTA